MIVAPDTSLHTALRSRRDEVILDALRACRGNRRVTASHLKVSLRTLLGDLKAMRARGVAVPSRQPCRCQEGESQS